MVISHWSLVIGHWSLVIGHWSLVIGHWEQTSPLHPVHRIYTSGVRSKE
ncbi:hypothetical protein [Nodularia spumigena]|nr:hypothetical protein [Nodularia spumigena]